jgi:hypothetical protein
VITVDDIMLETDSALLGAGTGAGLALLSEAMQAILEYPGFSAPLFTTLRIPPSSSWDALTHRSVQTTLVYRHPAWNIEAFVRAA